MDEKKNYKSKVEALVERTIAECRQQGFTINEMQIFLTLIHFEISEREQELRKESFWPVEILDDFIQLFVKFGSS